MKKATSLMLFTIFLTALFTACAPKYFGKTYAPTQNVDVYLDRADVKKGFTTMGTTSVGKGFSSLESAQQKVIELGKAKGADGVIMTLTEEVISTSQSGTTVVNRSKKKNVIGTSASSTTDVKEKKITATFIKYE
jgi:hypothetical protein